MSWWFGVYTMEVKGSQMLLSMFFRISFISAEYIHTPMFHFTFLRPEHQIEKCFILFRLKHNVREVQYVYEYEHT